MQDSEHTFPLPEVEVHKLEEVEHQIEGSGGTAASRVSKFVRDNKWSLLTFSVLGAAIGWALYDRRS